MATITTSYKNADVYGVPAFEVMDLYVDSNLLAGAEPGLQPSTRILLADSQDLAQFAVVGLNATGKIVMAAYNATLASAVKPVGVLAHAATSGASNTTKYGEVFLTGVFNAGDDSPLVWDASFDTLVKKTEWVGLVGNPNLIFRERLV